MTFKQQKVLGDGFEYGVLKKATHRLNSCL